MPGNAPALEKGLRILELSLAADGPLTLSRLAEGVGFKVSEIQRMVDYLARDGYLTRTEAGAYAPGLKAYGLADRKLDSAVIARAEGPMRRYAARTEASVHLGVLVDASLHVIFEVPGTGNVRIGVRPGVYDAATTPSGRLLRAFAAGSRDEPESAALRDAGFSFGELPCAAGVFAVAVPLPVGRSPCAATLASPYVLKDRGADPVRADLVAELSACAAEIRALF